MIDAGQGTKTISTTKDTKGTYFVPFVLFVVKTRLCVLND
jgi:hypothetical protein